MTEQLLSPVKWTGSKLKLLDTLESLKPDAFNTYCEPFLGGGSFFLRLQHKKAIVNDINPHLIALFETIRDNPQELIELTSSFKKDEDSYMEIRAWDRDVEGFFKRSKVEKAARLLYLNRMGFNGLYRVNSKGFFNVPYNKNPNATVVFEDRIFSLHKYLKENDITFMCGDFRHALKRLKEGDFVYFDPPYEPISKTSSFTSYDASNFLSASQKALKEACDDLNERGIKFMLSNSMSDYVLELYNKYSITKVKTKRIISAKTESRGMISEVIVRNYFANDLLDGLEMNN